MNEELIRDCQRLGQLAESNPSALPEAVISLSINVLDHLARGLDSDGQRAWEVVRSQIVITETMTLPDGEG